LIAKKRTHGRSEVFCVNFNSLAELKDFLIWAKNEKIAEIEVAGVNVKFSPLAFVGNYPEIEGETSPNIVINETLGPVSPEEAKEDKELLYWSASNP
jgi:hypothetical protein